MRAKVPVSLPVAVVVLVAVATVAVAEAMEVAVVVAVAEGAVPAAAWSVAWEAVVERVVAGGWWWRGWWLEGRWCWRWRWRWQWRRLWYRRRRWRGAHPSFPPGRVVARWRRRAGLPGGRWGVQEGASQPAPQRAVLLVLPDDVAKVRGHVHPLALLEVHFSPVERRDQVAPVVDAPPVDGDDEAQDEELPDVVRTARVDEVVRERHYFTAQPPPVRQGQVVRVRLDLQLLVRDRPVDQGQSSDAVGDVPCEGRLPRPVDGLPCECPGQYPVKLALWRRRGWLAHGSLVLPCRYHQQREWGCSRQE